MAGKKFVVMSPIMSGGKRFEVGDEAPKLDGKDADELLALGAIAPATEVQAVKQTQAQLDALANGASPAAAVQAAAAAGSAPAPAPAPSTDTPKQ